MRHTSEDHFSDSGASAVEYALIAVGVAALIAGIVFILGQTVFDSYGNSCDEITNGEGDC